jgi:hypothetical protein
MRRDWRHRCPAAPLAILKVWFTAARGVRLEDDAARSNECEIRPCEEVAAPSAGSVSPERLEPAPVAIRSGGGHVVRDDLITGESVGPAQRSGASSGDGTSFGIRTRPLAFARPSWRSD